MKRITLLFTVAAVMAAMLAVSAGPASALVIFDRNNDHNDSDRDNDHNRDTFFSIGTTALSLVGPTSPIRN